MRNDTDKFDDDLETCSIKIINSKSKNFIITSIYRPPKSDVKLLKNYCKNLLKKKNTNDKTVFILGDLNVNSLDYDNSESVKKCFNMFFQCGFLPLIQRATRVTRTTATAIDHIITDAIFDRTMHSGIIKTQISDHFPIFTILENCKNCKNNEKTKITKRDFNKENIQNFHFLLENINWDQFLPSNAPNEAYNNFLKIFSDLYDIAFPKKEIEIKSKYLNTPWITIGLRKSSKRKQRLHEKFLKKRTLDNEKIYKDYKNLFEKIKKCAKKNYYRNKIKLFENDIRGTWKIMKEIIGKKKCNSQILPKQILVDKIEVNDARSIAEKFNEFFVNVGPNLAKIILQSDINFESYLPKVNATLKESSLPENELEEAVKSLKKNKASGPDGLDVNIIISVYKIIKRPLLKIFNDSLHLGIFPQTMKIAKVLPFYKSGKKNLMTNYRPISVLSSFSKILERIMYNRLYSYLNDNNLFFQKQFGFREGHSTNHAHIQLINNICDSFN